MKLLVTGDLVVDCKYERSRIDEKLTKLFRNSNCNIVNLEAPISFQKQPIEKTGPNISSNKNSVRLIFEEFNINIACLANNHLYDYGEEGVKSTIDFCKEVGIDVVGGGHNLEAASSILYKTTSEGILAFINIAENEWSTATDNSSGANPISLIDNYRSIVEAKENADYIILIFHGGTEMYHLPSPEIQNMCRFFIDIGVDVVIGHHPHVIGGVENYKGKKIFYSLGNFLFTERDSNPYWYIGSILEINIEKGSIVTNLHYTKFDEIDFSLKLLQGHELKEVLNFVASLEDSLKCSKKLKEKWEELVIMKYNSFMQYYSPTSFISNRYVRGVFNRLGWHFLSKRPLLLILNLIRCESHLNLSKDVLKLYFKKNKSH